MKRKKVGDKFGGILTQVELLYDLIIGKVYILINSAKAALIFSIV